MKRTNYSHFEQPMYYLGEGEEVYMKMNINAMGNLFYSLLKQFKTYIVLELFSSLYFC